MAMTANLASCSVRPIFKICKAVVGRDGGPCGTFPLSVLHVRCGIGTTDKVLSPDAASLLLLLFPALGAVRSFAPVGPVIGFLR